MTSTRARLAMRLCQEDNRYPDGHHDGCETICVHEGKDSVCPYLRDALAAIDELMEPGEGAKLIGARSIGKTMKYPNHTERAKDCWQAMLKAIRNGA